MRSLELAWPLPRAAWYSSINRAKSLPTRSGVSASEKYLMRALRGT